MMMKKLFISTLLILITAALYAQTPLSFTVNTQYGQVRGIDQEGTMAFLGIPYARVERFMPPHPATPWTGVRDCGVWGPQAMQRTYGRKLSEAEMS